MQSGMQNSPHGPSQYGTTTGMYVQFRNNWKNFCNAM